MAVCGPDSEVYKALISIVNDKKIDETAAADAKVYLEGRLKPIVDEGTSTLLETIVLQIVFFFIILLIFLIVCIVVCGNAVGLSAFIIVGIIVLLTIVGVVFLAIISVNTINSARETIGSVTSELIQLDTSQELLDVLDTAAEIYLVEAAMPV